jgi:hypothetical protein
MPADILAGDAYLVITRPTLPQTRDPRASARAEGQRPPEPQRSQQALDRVPD